MSSRVPLLTILLVFTILFSSGNQSHASYAKVEAAFNWSKLTISGAFTWIDGDPSYPKYSYVEASVRNDEEQLSPQIIERYSWEQMALHLSVREALSESISSDVKSRAYSYAGPGLLRPQSASFVRKGGYFTYLGDQGQVTLTIPVYALLDLFASPEPNGYASGSVYMSIYFLNVSTWTGKEWTYNESRYVSNGERYRDTFNDTVSLTIYFDPNDIGSIFLEAHTQSYAESTVPLPGSVLLLSSGLLSLISLRVRFFKIKIS